MRVAVFGAGYVGLVSGTCLAELGNDVIFVDVDKKRVEGLKKGKSPIYEPGLHDLLLRNIKEKRLSFTTDPKKAIQTSKIIFIAVGTPDKGDGSTDLSYVFSAAKEIGKHINEYKVVVNKSTVPVETAEKVENIINKNMAGKYEFDVVSNPEFLREGQAVYDFMNPDRVVLGSNSKQATEIMRELYQGVIRTGKPLFLTDVKSAELIKYAGNAMLAARISFMNQLSHLCEKTGADIKEIAKGIGLDTRIGSRFLQAGIGYGGSCLLGDELILIKEKDEIRPIKIKEFEKYKDFSVLQIASFNQKTKKIEFKKITSFTKRKYDGEIVKVKTRMNKTIHATQDHPFIVYEKSEFKIKPASDLTVNDKLLAFSNLPTGKKNFEIDVIKILDKKEFDFSKVRVRPFKKRYSDYKKELSNKFKASRRIDIFRANCMNLNEYLTSGAESFIGKKEVVLFTSRGPTTYFPAWITVNSDFMRLLGYYISEGHIHYEKSKRGIRTRIAIHFNINENEYINDLKKIYDSYNIKYSISTREKNSTTTISVSSRIMAHIIDKYLNCGKDSYTANIPDFVFSLRKEEKLEFLKALFRGDGHIAFPKNTNSVVYDYGSISYELVHKAILLFSSIGIIPSYKTSQSAKSTGTAHFFRISTKKQIEKLRNFKTKQTQAKVDKTLSNCKDIKSVGFSRLNNDVCVVDINSLEKYNEKTDVYSVEVKGNETFITSHGLIVHNCFPKDVASLAYTLKQKGLKADLFESVIEINKRQKLVIVDKVKKAIGKNLKGKIIGVLGLSFKPKTDDMRDAPSIGIINQLQEAGAEIKAFDPQAMKAAKKHLKNITCTIDAYKAAEQTDALLLLTEWNEFRNLDMTKIKNSMKTPNLFDGRNIYSKEKIIEIGFRYEGIGK